MAILNQFTHERLCTKCGQHKPIAGFYKKRTGLHGYASECKECTILRTRTRYRSERHAQIRVKDNASNRRHTAKLKDMVFTFYGGYRCACCGITEKRFLTLDHVNNDGAEFRRKITGSQFRGAGVHTYRWLVKNAYPPGYQILCANCNFGKRMNNGVCPHSEARNDQSVKLVGSSEPKQRGSIVDEYFRRWIMI